MSVPAARQPHHPTDPVIEQETAQVSEPQYRLLFDANPQPMWVFDQASKRLLAVNNAAIACYGYPRDAFLQLTVMDIRRTLLGERLTAAQIDEDPMGASGLRLTPRWKHALKDGSLIDVDVTSSDVSWEGRDARLVVVNDVTEQLAMERKTELAFNASATALALLDHVVNRVGDAIIALDNELRFTFLNAAALRLLERENEGQLIGRYIWDEYVLEHGRAFHNAYVKALQTQQSEVFEAFYQPWDKWVEVRVFPSPQGLSIFCNDITERKLFERLLLSRERDFRLLVEHMPAMIYRASVDPPYSALYVSPSINILGYTAHEWLADPLSWTKALHPDDCERAMAALSKPYVDGEDHQIQYRLRDAQGQWRHFRDRSRRIDAAYGRPAFVQGIALDVTDLVESEQALRESEASLRRSEQRYRLAAAGGQVWDWDLVTDQLNLSPDFWLQLGFQPVPADQYRRHLDSMTHPQDIQRHREAMRAHLKHHQPFNIEVRIGDARGEWRWLHIQGQAEWDAQGRAIFMAGTTVDITPRKKAEAALRESEAYRRSLFEQLADGVLLIDFNNRILDANSQALSMLGHEGQSLVDVSLQSVLVDQRPGIPHDTLLENPQGVGPLVEWTIVRRDGSRLPVEVRTRALDATRYIAVLRDVADRHAAQTALVRYQLELSELTQRLLTQEKNTSQRVAQALHDNLGQSLAVARLNLDAVVATAGDTLPPVLAEQCQQLARMLAQAVLDVREVLADLRPPLLEEQGLAAALDNEIRTTLLAIGTDVLLEVADGLTRQRWPLDVEYSAFMVVREAIANARLHARSSLIRVLLEGDASTLRLDVVDDGVGIPQDMQLGRPGHLGVVGMRERSISIGARFSVTGENTGGTRVTLHWEAPRS
ncbi:MAG: PAS domain S-box protein [Hydrogenophaga sp.]|uniref:PAS domain-containing sensor histidine kinase n=1 Tax=Hydrogenophaga sp. TaxID=1904254 RepID=UPI002ABCCB88|nr:PAS domain S-box protein [Hydrogenophaga sp.]MDZ4103310.1 PAS domain S-box protein [Hydrogenophaga sp.]